MTPKLYMPQRIPTLEQYRTGLAGIDKTLTNLQRRLLIEQYNFPDHRCFAAELADVTGAGNWRVVNLQYARAAEKFCNAADFLPNIRRHEGTAQWWSVWSFGFDHGAGRFSWQMHPDLARTLKELDWVGAPHSHFVIG